MPVRRLAREVLSYLRHRPLFVLSLLVILVLGTRELTSSNSLSAEDRRILAERAATATIQAVYTATALAVQPVVDDQGVGDGETTPASYPSVPWTIGWSYNCGPGLPHASFLLNLYDAADTSYMHGVTVARARGTSGSGSTAQSPGRASHEFVIDPQTRCAWHVKVMRGLHTVAPSNPKPDHT
jgi:hypothetical protein